MGVLLIYDRLRGYADGLLVHQREVPQIKIEAALFGKPIPTVWLQSHLWHGANDLRWYDYADLVRLPDALRRDAASSRRSSGPGRTITLRGSRRWCASSR